MSIRSITGKGTNRVIQLLESIESINTDILSGGADPTSITDADEDTYVRTEQVLAENKIRLGTNGSERMIIDESGLIGIGTSSPDLSLVIVGTDGIRLPVGTTAQRPSGTEGDLRYNTTTDLYEGYFGGAVNDWTGLGGIVNQLDFTSYTLNETSNEILLLQDAAITPSVFHLKQSVDGDATFIATSRSADADTDFQVGYTHQNISSDSETITKLFSMKSKLNSTGESHITFTYISDTIEYPWLHLEKNEVSLGDSKNYILGLREDFDNPKKALAIFGASEIGIRIITDDAVKSDIGFMMNSGDVADAAAAEQSINNGMRIGAININEFHIDTNKLVRLRIDVDGHIRIGDAVELPTAEDITHIFEIVVPTDGEALCFSGSTGATDATTVSTNVVGIDFAVAIDTKATTVDGGTFTSGAWQTRTLNSLTQTNGFASLSSNQITLPAGTYIATFFAPAYAVNAHQARVQDITNTITLATGTNAYSNATQTSGNTSGGTAIFTLSGTAAIELQHQCETTKADDGFGQANSFGGVENYGSIQIQTVSTAFSEKIKIDVNGSEKWLYTTD